jgi:uracil-DNA glycosylase
MLRTPAERIEEALNAPGLDPWRQVLSQWRSTSAAESLLARLDQRHREGVSVVPDACFRALELTPLPKVRVVILGQDPYHGQGQAQGLAFSVPADTRIPPSLRNILAEVARDTGSVDPLASRGDLTAWAEQGVLLLNAALTVELGTPGAHLNYGWSALTTAILQAVLFDAQASNRAVVGMLWGASAQQAARYFERATAEGARCCVLIANHPSPLAARRPPRPFIGCGHFSQAAQFLAHHHPTDPVLRW